MNLKNHLASILKIPDHKITLETASGGSINQSYLIQTENKKFFCKTNSLSQFPSLFAGEVSGLQILRETKVFRIPELIYSGGKGDTQILVLEFISPGIRTENFWKLFGEKLAMLHSVHSMECGLEEDNYMGSLPQSNRKSESWTSFFLEERIRPQVDLAARSGFLQAPHLLQFEKLYKALPEIFPDDKISLLHGDLWSGNFLCDEFDSPVLIDPALYFGSRHMDLAMTTLFGGFDPAFYDSYRYYFQFPANYREIWELCNLYPLLVHLNLFGSSYLKAITSTISRF